MNVVSIHSRQGKQVTATDHADSREGNLHCTFSHVSSCLFHRRCGCVEATVLAVVTEGPPSH